MSEHIASVRWRRSSEGFGYRDYNREHEWHFENGSVVPASAAPKYLGKETHVDPEEAFVASVSSCHMLTFLAICSKKRIVVNRYNDRAIGYLAANESGKLAITRIELAPDIEFEGKAPDAGVLEQIHHLSHEECFIANSIHTDVVVTRYR